MQDTIAAISTPFGEGAIAVLRLSGPRALEICGSGLSRRKGRRGAVAAGAAFRRDFRGGAKARRCAADGLPRAAQLHRAKMWWRLRATAGCWWRGGFSELLLARRGAAGGAGRVHAARVSQRQDGPDAGGGGDGFDQRADGPGIAGGDRAARRTAGRADPRVARSGLSSCSRTSRPTSIFPMKTSTRTPARRCSEVSTRRARRWTRCSPRPSGARCCARACGR